MNTETKHFPSKITLPLLLSLVMGFLFVMKLEFGIQLIPFFLTFPFADMATITGSVDCLRAGMDPYTTTQFDPLNRLFNYPRLWLTIFDSLGITLVNTNAVGIVLIICYSLFAGFLFRIRNTRELLIALLVLLSPPVLLGLERGNSDVIIFILLLYGIYFLRKLPLPNPTLTLWLAYFILLLAAFLKLYPILLIVLLPFENTDRKHRLGILLTLVVAFGVYIWYYRDDLNWIGKNTPTPEAMAYGRLVILQSVLKGNILKLVSIAGVLIMAGFSYWVRRPLQTVLIGMFDPENLQSSARRLFIAGSILYCGTFVAGSNWDYRLIFLLFTFPWIFDLLHRKKEGVLIIGLVSIILLVMYGSFLSEYIRYMSVLKWLASWMLFGCLLTGLMHLAFPVQKKS